jgi:hypothetical protein
VAIGPGAKAALEEGTIVGLEVVGGRQHFGFQTTFSTIFIRHLQFRLSFVDGILHMRFPSYGIDF